MIIVAKHTNFGSRKTGLSTVGYKLLNEDNTEKQARTTTGVTEWIAATGLYGALISFDDNWRGMIAWDTGEATPMYAFDYFNHLEYEGSGLGGVVVQGEFLSKAEKESLIAAISSISKAVAAQDKRAARIEQGISELATAVANLDGSVKAVQGSLAFQDVLKKVAAVEVAVSTAAGKIREAIEDSEKRGATKSGKTMLAAVDAIAEAFNSGMGELDTDGARKEIKALQESMSAVKKELELAVKIAAKLISMEDLKTILKEGGFDVAKFTR